ncbi:MAG: hypothetical protein HQL60_05930 [Magnetococcales bacterium]|nr:hypothetical protein [Magnetococcales bacterium]
MKIHITLLAITAVVAFLLLSLLWTGQRHLPIAHLVLAVGVLPLILGAMIQFIPALTRTQSAEAWITGLPSAATLAAVVAVVALEYQQRQWLLPAALLAMTTVVVLMAWIAKRAGLSLGGAHPGVRWYQAALVCLLFGLTAMVGALLRPDYWQPLRTLHVHLNLIGFVGLTAIGTLQVLLPTVAGYRDDRAAGRLCCHLKYAFLGSWMAAVGAAWLHPLSWLAIPLWLFPIIALLRPMWSNRQHLGRSGHSGAAVSLIGAIFGFVLTLFSGIPIMLHWISPEESIPLFLMLFVLPLVTGALSYLLPLWVWGDQPQRQQHGRVILSRGGALRTLLFLGSGMLVVAGNRDAALLVVMAVMAVFVMQMVWAWSKTVGQP